MKSRDIRKWLCLFVALAIILSAVPAFASESEGTINKEIAVFVKNLEGIDLGDFKIGITNFDLNDKIDVAGQLGPFGDREIISGRYVDPKVDSAIVTLSSLPDDSALEGISKALAKVVFHFVDENGDPLQGQLPDGEIMTVPSIIRDFVRGEYITFGEVIQGLPKGATLLNADEPIDTSEELNNVEAVVSLAAGDSSPTVQLTKEGEAPDIKVEVVADVNLMAIEMAPKQYANVVDAKNVVIDQRGEIVFDVENAEEIDILLASFTPEQRAEIINSKNVSINQIMDIYFNMYLNDPDIIVKDIEVFVPVKKVATTIPKTADPTSMMSLLTLMVSGMGMVVLKKKLR